jgi:MFS transporter, DHA1 family, tetracycline resistance protein
MARSTPDSVSDSAPGAATAEPRAKMPKGFWPIWTTVLIDLIGFGIALPVLGIYAKDKFQASGLMVGVLMAAYSAAQFVAAPQLGKLSDRYGRKPVLLISLLGTAIAATMTGFATSLGLLILWRFVDGLTGGTYGVAGSAIADITPPERRSALIGMLGAAFGVGFTIGPAIGALMSHFFGPRSPFFLLAALSLGNAIVMYLRVPETKGLAQQQADDLAATGADAGLATSWRDSGLPLLLGAALVGGFAFSAFEAHFSTFGRDDLGLTQSSAGWALAVVGVVVSIVQGGLIGPASKRFGDMPLAIGGSLITAVGLGLFGASSGWLSLLPAVLVISVGQGFGGPSLSAEISNRINPTKRGAILGVQQSCGAGASVLGPLLAGVAFDRIAHAAPFFIGAGLFLVAGVLLVKSARSKPTRPDRVLSAGDLVNP